MKILLLLITLFPFFRGQSLCAQIVYEDFEDSQLPQGWSTAINRGTCDWDIFSQNAPQGRNFESIALIFDDNLCGRDAEASNVSLTSATYDVSSINPLMLSVDIGLNTVDIGEQMTIEVYDGSAWQLIDTFTGDYNPFTYQAQVTAYANTDFKVRFTFDDNGQWSYYAGVDNFKLTQEELPPMPPQASCATAPTAVPGINTVFPIKRGSPPPLCIDSEQGTGGAWFVYTATRDGIATVSSELEQQSVDTRLSIFTGDCNALTCLASNDDVNSFSFFSEVTFLITQGNQYYIAFDDLYDNSGFDFSITEKEEPCVAGDNLTIDFSDTEEFETCELTIDGDDNGNAWTTDAADFKSDGTYTYFALNGGNEDFKKDDYLFSQKLTLDKNTSYSLEFTFNGGDTPLNLANENLEVFIADAQDPTATMISLYKKTNIVQEGGDTEIYDMATHVTDIKYKPERSGSYFLTFKVTSPAPSGFLFLFDYSFGVSLGINDLAVAKVEHFYDKRAKDVHLSSQQNLRHIALYNINGQLLIDQDLQGQTQKVNIASFTDGIYIVRVATDLGVERFKIIKR